jgi:methionyl-tRNA synthetase
MYVWCDALVNYITALGYGNTDTTLYETFWPANVHVIGKDILRFHAAIWPGMLLSAGVPLPQSILAHGFITSGGKKMSKSLGNVIDPEELLAEYGTDAVRYFLLRHVSPSEDGDITREAFKDAYNSGLANGLGNLSSRIMQLAQTHLPHGTRPEPEPLPAAYVEAFESYDVKQAAEVVWDEIQYIDRKITESAPFKLIKTDVEAGKAAILQLTQDLYTIARLLTPFLPDTAAKIKAAVVENKKPENLFVRKD